MSALTSAAGILGAIAVSFQPGTGGTASANSESVSPLTTLQGLTDFAVVQSYLSTAAKWGWTSWRRCVSCLRPARGCRRPSAPLAD
jgi:hypothetical protein